MGSLLQHPLASRGEVTSEPVSSTVSAKRSTAKPRRRARTHALSALISALAVIVLSTAALAGTAFAAQDESTSGSDNTAIASMMESRLSASAVTASDSGSVVASKVYAFACQKDGSDDVTLVIKKGTDEPDADTYGLTVSDWHKDTDAHKAIDITDWNNSNADGGIAYKDPDYSWNDKTGTSANYWPWRVDEDYRSKITKVVVEDGVAVPSVYYMFAGLENVTEFDLSGLDTTNVTKQKNYGLYYADPYSYTSCYTFGKYGSTTANEKPSSAVQKIVTCTKWDMPTLFGFFNASSNNKTGTTFYFTARDNTIVSRAQYKANDLGPNPKRSYWEWLPQDGFKHIYYTSEDACKANQEVDYKTCYGDTDPTSYKDKFGFTTQPYDISRYTNATYTDSLATKATYSPANGCVGEKAVSYQWYMASAIDEEGTAIANATSATLNLNTKTTILKTTPGYAYFYCTATNTEAENGGTGTSNRVKVAYFDAADGPVVSSQPEGTDPEMPKQYTQGEVASSLTVGVSAAGTTDFMTKYGLSETPAVGYQWYRAYGDGEFEAIEGATSASYTPSTRGEAGVYKYYCELTYTVDTYAHGVSTIVTTSKSDTAYVQIELPSAQPGTPVIQSVAMNDASYTNVNDTVDYLTVKASVENGTTGTLTYKWYASDDEVASPDTDEAIVGAEGTVPSDGVISILPSSKLVGDKYYYCVVTNTIYTDATTSGIAVATATSALAKISMVGTVHVSEPTELLDVVNNPLSYKDLTIKIDNDIDLSSNTSTAKWKTGASLSGATIDGQGHTVKGLNIVDSSSNASGAMFGTLTDCTVKNLIVEGTVQGSATFANSATKCTFENVVSRCSVTTNFKDVYAAGFVSQAVNCTFKNCGNEGDISNALTSTGWHAQTSNGNGGIVGLMVGASTFSGCYNSGSVSAQSAAGIIGQAVSEENLSYSTYNATYGDVIVENCYNSGTINTIQPDVAYPDESQKESASYYWPGTSGLVGAETQMSISSSWFGSNVKISNCYNVGSLTFWNKSASGLDQQGIDAISYNDGTNQASVTNSYYLSGNGWDKSYAAASKSVEELSSLTATLNGAAGAAWKDGARYPILAWQTSGFQQQAAPEFADQEVTEYETAYGTAFSPITVKAEIGAGVKAAYRGTISYQWYSNTAASTEGGTAIEGATAASYTPDCKLSGDTYYYCVATNTYEGGAQSSTSALFKCSVNSSVDAATPVIESQTESAVLPYGEAPVYSVTASVSGEGAGTLTYQWYQMRSTTQTEPGTNDYKRGTDSTYTLANAADYYFYCVITNTYTNTTSEVKTASVTTKPIKLTWEKEITVSTPAELKAISDTVADGKSYSGVTVKLANDIDLSSDPTTAEWQPIGNTSKYFAGEFDGCGHTISGLSVTSTKDSDYVGLFGYVYPATIHDLTVIGSVSCTGKSVYAGGLIGCSKGNTKVYNVSTKVNISGDGSLGGIIGRDDRRTLSIDSCTNWGNISNSRAAADASAKFTTSIGGILGSTQNAVTITNCSNRGTLSGPLAHQQAGIGGIVGGCLAAGKISNCYSSGSVSATGGDYANQVGPICGRSTNASFSMSNCYYLDGSCTGSGVFDGTVSEGACTKMTDAELSATAAVDSLNGSQTTMPWKAGSTYPVLTGASAELASLPIIDKQPAASSVYLLNAADVKPLEVSASAASGLTYQWFSNTTASTEGATELTGATSASFKPVVTASGTTYYFCKVTSGQTSVTSDFAEVFVAGATPAATPVISAQPVSATVDTGAEAEALAVEAGVSGDGAGELSYQWYKMSGSAPDAKADKAIEGATEASYVPDTSATASYYCVVTNTFDRAKTASATSEVATVTCVNRVVKISSLAELAAFRDDVNAGNDYFGVTVELEPGTYDFALSTATSAWKPIGTQTNATKSTPFRGTFEGNGSVLKNVNVTNPASYSGALFSAVDGGTLQNFTLEASFSDLPYSCGGLVAATLTNGTVSNVTVKGTLNCASSTYTKNGPEGGVIGQATGSLIENVTADVEICGLGLTTGGIVGTATDSTIQDCTVSGSMKPAGKYTQGHPAGGIVGKSLGSAVIACGSSMDITESTSATNINDSNVSKIGGIVGSAEGNAVSDTVTTPTTIVACKNSGAIAGTQRIGGIAGQLLSGSTVDSCYNAGEVTYVTVVKDSLTGGIVGKLETGSKIANSYSTGAVNASSANCGGLVGQGASADIASSYYANSAYPSDASGIVADTMERMAGKDFVANVNGSGCFTYNPEGTPALYWETPHYLSDDYVVLESESFPYAGSAIEPAVKVTFPAYGTEGVELTEGVDYEVAYADNVKPGTATVTVTGVGDYSGTVTKTFAISTAKLTVTAGNFAKYAGDADPELTFAVDGLADGDEFRYASVTREAGEAVGTYKVTVSGGIVVRGDSIVTDGYEVEYVAGELTVIGKDAVYRMYNPTTSEHLFTTDADEYAGLVAHGWKQEGEAWASPADGKGVYRLYNAGLGALGKMSHHYTTDKAEAEKLVAENGWVYDNGGKPLFYSAEDESGAFEGAAPVYRLYNGGLSAHHYTMDKSEADGLVKNSGWTLEGEGGIGFYALPIK